MENFERIKTEYLNQFLKFLIQNHKLRNLIDFQIIKKLNLFNN
jgi:hypothetical protein